MSERSGCGQVRPGYSLTLYSLGLASEARPYPVAYGSYAGIYGSLLLDAIPRPGTRRPREMLAQVNGSFHDDGPIRLSSFLDGLSHTGAVSERAPLPPLPGRLGRAKGRPSIVMVG